MSANSLVKLQASLRLPQAQLVAQRLEPEALQLHLLHLPDPLLQLSTPDIAYFWEQLPYWAFAWAGGRALAQWLGVHPEAVAGKRVVDFGCGSGLVGIAAALAGAKEVWVADLDANALLAAQINARANGVHLQIVDATQWPEVDVLLASDVLYDISSSADLQRWMLQVPTWYLAESKYVKPAFIELKCAAKITSSTLPVIGDFDEYIDIEIYTRSE